MLRFTLTVCVIGALLQCTISMDGEDPVNNVPTGKGVKPRSAPTSDVEDVFGDGQESSRRTFEFEPQPQSINIPKVCGLFPHNCIDIYGSNLPTRADYWRCPIDIPYCKRTACSTDPSFNTDPKKCLSTPGCCYDYPLSEYRRYYQGFPIMGGAPTCYKGYQNKKFLDHAKDFVAKSATNRWDPRYAKCLIETYKPSIMGEIVKGCSDIKMLEFFGFWPKQAGWSSISPEECHMINKCWVEGKGCFHPVDENITIKPGVLAPGVSNNPQFRRFLVGREQCQSFPSPASNSPTTFFTNYHKCLLSGCTLHPVFDDKVYYRLFYNLAQQLENPNERRRFLYQVYTAEIGPDNYEAKIEEIREQLRKEEAAAAAAAADPFAPFLMNPADDLAFTEAVPDDNTQSSMRSFNSFQNSGPPQTFGIPNACPYAKPMVPNAPPLPGSTEGCCKGNLCFSLGSEEVTSGVSHYYTPWGMWSQCAKSCGGGQRKRRRRCIAYERVKSDVCTESISETGSCNDEPCPAWAPWGDYGECTKTCGGGIQTRQRSCVPLGAPCPGSPIDTRDCRTGRCPVYGRWSDWSRCSNTCGVGKQQRSKNCEDPGPYGCPKPTLTETRECKSYCGTLKWSEWSECNSQTCQQTRVARCDYFGRVGYCSDGTTVNKKDCFTGLCLCKHPIFASSCSGLTNINLSGILGTQFGG